MKFWYLLQHRWTLKTLCSVKEGRHKRPHIVWFHLYEISRIGKSIETENRLSEAWAKEGRWEWLLHGYGVSFWGGENIVELDRGGGCTIQWKCLMPMLYTSNGWFYVMCARILGCFSHVWLFLNLWTVACRVPLSMGFSRQEYWNGLPCPPAGDLPDPRVKRESPESPALQADSYPWDTEEALCYVYSP